MLHLKKIQEIKANPGCAYVGVVTSVLPSSTSASIPSVATSCITSNKSSYDTASVLSSSHTPPAPHIQPSQVHGPTAAGLIPSKYIPESPAVITSNPAVISSPLNQQQQVSRTVVTAVVTVASTDHVSFTNLPPKLQTKNMSSHVPGFTVDSVHKTETAHQPSVIDAMTPVQTSKVVPAAEHATSSPHWNVPSEKDILLSQPPVAGMGNNKWPGAVKPDPSSQLSSPSDLPRLLNAMHGMSSPVCKADSRISHTSGPHVSNSTVPYLQQTFLASAYEHPSLHNLAKVSSGATVKGGMLQNPQLMQHQHSDYLAEAASSNQFQERGAGQIGRPSTPVASGIPPEVAARLGNHTPSHTPTPPVTTSTHSVQPSEVRGSHVSGLHFRHASQPQPPLSMNIRSQYFSQQVLHPSDMFSTRLELRAPQMTDLYAYAAISHPHPAVSPSSFHRMAHPSDGMKLDGKTSVVEIPNHLRDGRSRTPDDKALHSSKVMRMKKGDKELKMLHAEEQEIARPSSAHEKSSINAQQSLSLRQQYPFYPPTIRHPSPLHTIPHERITDSPINVSVHASSQGRITQMSMPDQLKDKKLENALTLHQSLHGKGEIKQPPAAHQSHTSPMSYHHSLDALVRQQLLVGSPVPGFVDGQSASQPAHSPNALHYKKDSNHLQGVSAEKQVTMEVSKKMHGRTLAHQRGTPSPGLVNAHSAHLAAIPPPAGQHVPPPISEMLMPIPPPAHALSQAASIPQMLAPTPQPNLQQGESYIMHKYPVVWQGLLALKNYHALVQMHFVSGNLNIARASLPPMVEGETSAVRISQRMRLEETQLNGVVNKMLEENEHCILIAFPCGKDAGDVEKQSSNLNINFIKYLLDKGAAGIVNAAAPGHIQPAYVIHIFPPSCKFSEGNLKTVAPRLADMIADITHLAIIIATV